MNKCLVMLLIMIGFGFNVNAKKVSGILKTIDNEQREVNMEIPMFTNGTINLDKIQKRLFYYNEQGKKKSISLKEVSEISFDLEGDNYRFLSLETKLGAIITAKKYRLVQLLIDGNVKLCSIHYVNNVRLNSTLYIAEKDSYVINLEGKTAEMLTLFNHKKIFSRMSSRCEAFKDKMSSKEFGIHNIPEMVLFFNEHCEK